MNLDANATVSYLVQIVLLNFSKDFQRFLINYGHAIVDFGLVSVCDSSEKTKGDDKAATCNGNVDRLSYHLRTTFSKLRKDEEKG